MTASLLIARTIEVIDKSVGSSVRLASGFDFGEGEPDQATIGSIYLDGESVTGRRTKNRQMQLPLNVYGASATDVAATMDALRALVDQDTFEVQWTPDGGLPIVFDGFRATPSRERNPNVESTGLASMMLTFPAKPFGRSPGQQAVSAAATATQLDNFDSARTGGTLDNTQHFEGSGSAKIALTVVTSFGAKFYSTAPGVPLAHSFGSPVNLTGMNAVSVRAMWPAPGGKSTMTFALTLTSAAGNATIVATKTFNNGDGTWRLVAFPLTGSLGSLDLTQVTGYTLTLQSTGITGGTSPSNAWIDDMREQPPSSALTTTTHGANLLLPSTVGSARAPANLALSTGGTFGQFLLHTPPGDQDPDAQILTSLNAAVADQTVTIAAANAALRGTFSLILGGATDGTGATMTVTVTQKENGTTVATQVLSKAWDITTQGLLCPVGEVTLPLRDTPADNSLTSYTIEVNITLGTDRFSELMLCDTTGQTILTDAAAPSTGTIVYVDEPAPLQSGPSVYISANGARTAAYSKLGDVVMSGGPILLDPGVNKLLMWTEAGTPSLTASYYPRWLDERIA